MTRPTIAIIGAGIGGLAAAAALRLLGIDRVRVLDRARPGREGPWVTFARMETLRSPKALAGPALGLPASSGALPGSRSILVRRCSRGAPASASGSDCAGSSAGSSHSTRSACAARSNARRTPSRSTALSVSRSPAVSSSVTG